MSSSSKTPNLGLNSWSETDKPKRVDFVEDNTILDSKLGAHLADTNLHLSTSDREKINSLISAVSYSGTGASSRSISFGFSPTFVVVFKRFDSFCSYDSSLSCTKINGAFFSVKETTDDCGRISGTSLVVKQSSSAEDGVFYNLNEQYGQYVAVAFR
ncbi:MAG: hypothetical protein PUD24_06780 [Oscillospiraceae bacterium]|nr:hypothetical protein [Oscillospiraceae bacterium]